MEEQWQKLGRNILKDYNQIVHKEEKYTCVFKPKKHPLEKPRKIVLDKFNIDKDRQEFMEKEFYKAITPMLELFKEVHEVRIEIIGKWT